ncbi:MAG TPA: hypothetical protein VHB02_03775 [Acidimicrobiales bacterium]|nr:hypothetical protein [Acidimicrobiales bacterium]
MTILAYSHTAERVLLAADSGLLGAASEPSQDRLPPQAMAIVPKLFQVGAHHLAWGLTGDAADIPRFREWVDQAPLESWSSFAEAAAVKVLSLYQAALERAHRSKTKKTDVQPPTVLIGGTVGGDLNVAILEPNGNPYFVADIGEICSAVGIYGPAFGIAVRAARQFAPDLALAEPDTLRRLLGVFCDALPTLERPVQVWSITKTTVERG